MSESERVERLKYDMGLGLKDSIELDEILSNRIIGLLNHTEIDKYCMVDAYYYDFSAIPYEIQKKLDMRTDCYLIYGITHSGEIIYKWIKRYDIDSDKPIVNGDVRDE